MRWQASPLAGMLVQMSDPRPLYVAGEWVSTEATRAVMDPATGVRIATVCLATDAVVEQACASAVAA